MGMHLELKTARLLLRPVQWEDLPSIYEYGGNWENARYMVYLPFSSIEDTKEFMKEANGPVPGG